MDKARRDELKLAYKLAFPAMGIYAVRNLANGRLLLDKSNNLPGALNRHRLELKLGTHRNRALMQDWREFGAAQFDFEILDQIEENKDPAFDYAAELLKRLALWRARLMSASIALYN